MTGYTHAERPNVRSPRDTRHRWRSHGLKAMTVLLAVPVVTVLGTAPARAAVTPLVKVNFQPNASAVPAGYVKDTGAAYDTTRGFGWVRQETIARRTHTPVDLTSVSRDRARAGIDPRRNTLVHMQYSDVPRSGTPVPSGAWEYAVPPGSYQVTVSAGDQPKYDSVHVIRVEGVTAIDHFRADATTEFATATLTVPVADGRLSLDAVGGTNTKVNYVDIARVTTDATAPAAPTGLAAVPGDRQAQLTWKPSAESDLLGYRVYRNTVLISGAGVLKTPTFADTTAPNGTAASYRITALDRSGNESATSAAVSVTPAAFAIKVNFQDEASTPPAGYVKDFGQPFGARTGGLSYGWSELTDGGPQSMVGLGRDRGTSSSSDPRLRTFIHACYHEENNPCGTWEVAVPNGVYTVTTAAGEAGAYYNSVGYVSVEGQNAIAAFVPTSGTRFATATRTVEVTDGRLTLSPEAGTNVKWAYVDIASVAGSLGLPSVRSGNPGNLSTGVDPRSIVVEDLRLPNGGVDEATLTASSVTIARVSTGDVVPAEIFTSGGGDTINAAPLAELARNTLYRFSVTAAVKDVEGVAFTPYSVVFTTGDPAPSGGPAFTKVSSGAAPANYTSVTIGPDGRLYAATLDGYIHRYTISPDGTLSNQLVIDTVRAHAVTAALPDAPNRTIIGMAFDPASTSTNPVLWVSDNQEYVGDDVPDYTSKIAKLSGPNLSVYTEVLTNLPRSVKDHETNSLAFKGNLLYFTQGANNAMGAPDATWRDRPEHRLNAAVLRLDPSKLPTTLPLDVKTDDGGTYDPGAPNAPLTIYASGVRNAFDLVWHRNGHLYTPTNGSAAGGNTPATPTVLPASCSPRPDGAYTGPAVPGLINVPTAETDYVFDVKPGKYYGHPNPTGCQWVLAGGNPTSGKDPFEVPSYPVGTLPDRNYDLAGVYDAGLHASANGAIEYRGGQLDGKLLVVRYSASKDIQTFDVAASGALSNRTTGITGFTGFDQPLDLTEDVARGNLYVTELGGRRISLLRPKP